MAPPLFADLGKPNREIFDKGYILEIFKLTAKNSTCGLLKMKSEVVHKFEDGKFDGKVEGSYPYPQYGLTLTKKWNTDNVIGLAAELADKIYPGVILKAEGSFNPDTGVKKGDSKIEYKHEYVHADVAFSSGTDGEDKSVLDSSLVLGYEGWLSGARIEYNSTDGSVKDHYLGVGHSYGPLQAFLFNQNFSLYTASIYQRVNNRLEMGIKFGVDTGEEKKKFWHLGARYLLNEDTSVRAKVSNESMVGLGLETVINGCVRLIFSCELDGKKLNEGGHKFGMQVDIM